MQKDFVRILVETERRNIYNTFLEDKWRKIKEMVKRLIFRQKQKIVNNIQEIKKKMIIFFFV